MTIAARFDYAGYSDAVEDYFERGFTDGMPIVPPTPDAVEAMLAGGGFTGDEVLGEVPTRDVVVTAEQTAVNAVMAGCRTDYFPVVAAAVRAQLSPKANAHSTTATLAGSAHAVIINGPVRNEIDVCSGQACFGPGFRANATIGRAVRLVIRNVENSVPGAIDRATFSWPLRYSFCFGENEEASDWDPMHTQRGFARADSVVTVHSVMDFVQALEFDPDPEVILDCIAAIARQRGMFFDEWCGTDRSLVIVVGAEHQRRLVDAGLTKAQVQEKLWPRLASPGTGRHDYPVTAAAPDNILLVAAGGPGIACSWILLPHLSNPISELVTRGDAG
jgi:hypothetical protein